MSETTATEFDFEETNSNSGISETSSSPPLVDGGNFTIPQPPSESTNGKPFECPYCFFVITISGTRSWTKHILKDLQPYICTFPHCSRPDKLYDSRREWFDHITKVHLQGFDRHSTDRKPICPLCKDSMTSGKQLERHLARHLEELALFALSPNKFADDENDFNGSHALENDPREVVPPASPKREELDELEEQDAHDESASKGDHFRDEIDVYQESLDSISSDGVAQDVFDNLSDVTYVAQDELRSPPSARPGSASSTTQEDLDGDASLNGNSNAELPGPSGAKHMRGPILAAVTVGKNQHLTTVFTPPAPDNSPAPTTSVAMLEPTSPRIYPATTAPRNGAGARAKMGLRERTISRNIGGTCIWRGFLSGFA